MPGANARITGLRARTICGPLTAIILAASMPTFAQVGSRVDALVAALRPALPFPAADAEGNLPADGGSHDKWFVVWPGPGDAARIVVRANPLHPDTQKAGAAAMGRIQEAIVDAERRAQAAYDRALAEVKRTGKTADVEGISLDDEGIAGERIDADLELTIELQNDPQAFDIASSQPPIVVKSTTGPSWMLQIAPNTYRLRTGSDMREHFRPAEARLYFGGWAAPVVSRRGADHHFAINVTPVPDGFAVVLRGNHQLLNRVLATSDWGRLAGQ